MAQDLQSEISLEPPFPLPSGLSWLASVSKPEKKMKLQAEAVIFKWFCSGLLLCFGLGRIVSLGPKLDCSCGPDRTYQTWHLSRWCSCRSRRWRRRWRFEQLVRFGQLGDGLGELFIHIQLAQLRGKLRNGLLHFIQRIVRVTFNLVVIAIANDPVLSVLRLGGIANFWQFQCVECDKSFRRERDFKSHLRNIHFGEASEEHQFQRSQVQPPPLLPIMAYPPLAVSEEEDKQQNILFEEWLTKQENLVSLMFVIIMIRIVLTAIFLHADKAKHFILRDGDGHPS